MTTTVPAAVLNKMRPRDFSYGDKSEYFRILEGLLVQIQGQVGTTAGSVNPQDSAGVIDFNAIVNSEAISENSESILQNASDIIVNANGIAQNAIDIAGNADEIASNSDGIDQNEQLIFSIIPLVIDEFRKLSGGEYEPQFGSGSPEGVITANYSRQYFDTSIPEHWVNPVQGVNTGWVQVV